MSVRFLLLNIASPFLLFLLTLSVRTKAVPIVYGTGRLPCSCRAPPPARTCRGSRCPPWGTSEAYALLRLTRFANSAGVTSILNFYFDLILYLSFYSVLFDKWILWIYNHTIHAMSNKHHNIILQNKANI